MKNNTNKQKLMSYSEAIKDALDIILENNKNAFVIGEGIPDPKGAFGTTLGLSEKHGEFKIMDMPVSENGMTGIAIGASLGGMRPILTHMRVDFSLLSLDQIINNAAKWFFMYGGKSSVPIVIRLIIGRGWGQGPQHSQSLEAIFSHIPGLKVVMPASPNCAKGLLIRAVKDNNPVIFIEHRWLHNIKGLVHLGSFEIPIGKARIVTKGDSVTIVAVSFMVIEAIKAQVALKKHSINIEIIDLRSTKPIDWDTIFTSVKKTKRLITCDSGHLTLNLGAELIAKLVEEGIKFTSPPVRIALPDIPTPTAKSLAENYYKTASDIIAAVGKILGLRKNKIDVIISDIQKEPGRSSDQPDSQFTGPF